MLRINTGGKLVPSMRSDRALYADAGLTRLVEADEADIVIANGPGKTIHPTLVATLGLEVDAAGRVVQRGKQKPAPAEPAPENPKPKPRRSAPPSEKDATRRRAAKRKR